MVAADGCRRHPEELLEHPAGRVARWWLPERWGFVEAIPKTSVGKFDKKVLRAQHAAGDLEVLSVERPTGSEPATVDSRAPMSSDGTADTVAQLTAVAERLTELAMEELRNAIDDDPDQVARAVARERQLNRPGDRWRRRSACSTRLSLTRTEIRWTSPR